MPNLDQVWDAFEKKEKNTQSQYYMARCKFCKTLLEGRVRTLKYHLKRCEEYLNAEDEEEKQKQQALNCTAVSHQSVSMKRRFDFISKISGCDVVTSKQLKNHDNKTFLDREMTSYEEKNVLQRMIEMVADSGLPFQWVERSATIRFIESL